MMILPNGDGQAKASHAKILTLINAFFAADQRFSDVRWKFDWGLLDGCPGERVPVTG